MADPFPAPPHTQDSLSTPNYYGDPKLDPLVPGDRHLTLVKEAVRQEFLAEKVSFSDAQLDSFARSLLDNPDIAAQSDDALLAYDQKWKYSTSMAPAKASLGQLPQTVHSVLKSQTQDEDLNQLGISTMQSLGGHLTTAQKNFVKYGPEGKPQSMVDPLRDYEISQGIDPNLNSVYPGPVSAFEQQLGRKPKAKELLDILNHGSSEAEYESYIKSLDSHIKGMSIGTYNDLKSVYDTAMLGIFGHTAADSLIQDGYNSGLTAKRDVENWLTLQSMKPVKDIPPDLYASAYQAAVPHASGLYNDVPDPRDVAKLIASSGQVDPQPATQQKDDASKETPPAPDLSVRPGDFLPGVGATEYFS